MHYTFLLNYREIKFSKMSEELKWHVFSVSSSFGSAINKATKQLVSVLVSQCNDMTPEGPKS
jgi:hypothetical protein